ncbi:MAG: imidazoleglycerol-phosphate dehydratase HisB [Chloroflexi bacterium]|nr:imidazoleglycerol-phosphate dehydratase HisB [Chloroflexota bacterium]
MKKIALVLYPGVSQLDVAALQEALHALRGLPGSAVSVDSCALQESVTTSQAQSLAADRQRPDLSAYDWVVVPGAPDPRAALDTPGLLEWLSGASTGPSLAAVGSGSALCAAAGLITGLRTAANPQTAALLQERGAVPAAESLLQDGKLLSARGSADALALALRLCAALAGEAAAQQVQSALGLTPPAPTRTAAVTRSTRETSIQVSLDLDGSGKHQVSTGVPFFDHMLDQIAVHGLFDLQIAANGDVHIDPHHTMEDVGLTLGSAFREALGNKAGIIRMASFAVPMDESLARVTLDFSGRPYAVLHIQWSNPYLAGSIPTSLFEHFFESFAFEARCNLHIEVPYGRDDHHKAEAAFKALARALSAATRVDPRRAGSIPSSKGILM